MLLDVKLFECTQTMLYIHLDWTKPLMLSEYINIAATMTVKVS